MNNYFLINALGIVDSGGFTVLEKLISEIYQDIDDNFFIVFNKNDNLNQLFKKYEEKNNFELYPISSRNFLYRIYYENIKFRRLVKEKKINLVYNFSGSGQFFSNIPQLIKIQNLLFYSKKLDSIYKKRKKYFLWMKQIVLKRFIFKKMINQAKYFEIQSSHVKNYLGDYINLKNKKLFIKSDISIEDNLFQQPKKYDFNKKIKFLYIVGPHFEHLHKNFLDFVNVMIELNKKNIDFEINITLTKTQLNNSTVWDASLNRKTVFWGYISDKQKMKNLFQNNTILISTSIIETLGLHVIDAIRNGIIIIVPNENYSYSVYGKNIFTYELFNKNSLLTVILNLISSNVDYKKKIISLQNDLIRNEESKYSNILDIFRTIER